MEEGDCKPLQFFDLEVGMKVIDRYDHVGVIKQCDDINNVIIEFEGGLGTIFYCLDKNCYDYDELYQYDSI
jgi:hypothetical protein